MIQNLLNMEVNIYNVIWADDECATLKQDELIRKVFNEKRIEVLEYVPTSTALRNALETYKDEVDAVVVDGNFSKEDVDYLESDDISGLIHTVSFLELYNTKKGYTFFSIYSKKDSIAGYLQEQRARLFYDNQTFDSKRRYRIVGRKDSFNS